MRIRYKEYPHQQIAAGVYQAIQVGEDWGGGWQVEVHRRWGEVTTNPKDEDRYVGALHLSNNTAELTAAIQVMLYFTSLHEYANADVAVPPPPQNVLIVADSLYTINAATKRKLPYGRESPNVAIITVLREACKWVADSGTKLSWLHVKGHAQELGMVSDKGLKGSEGNEAADTCATNGKRGHTPRATGSIRTLTTLLAHTRRACTKPAGSAATLLKVMADGDPKRRASAHLFQHMTRAQHGPKQTAMWAAVNQPRLAVDGQPPDNSLVTTPDCTDDGLTLGPPPGLPATQLSGGEEPRLDDPDKSAPVLAPTSTPPAKEHGGGNGRRNMGQTMAVANGPGDRLPACATCGMRHGEQGMPTTCVPRGAATLHMPPVSASHPDITPTTEADAGPHCHGNHAAGAPSGMQKGSATGDDNTCLIHTLMQLVRPGGVWADDVRQCILIRRAMEVEFPMLRSNSVETNPFLTFALHWQPVLTALGVDYEDYRVVCYTPHGPERYGGGRKILSLWNGSYDHYEPLR